MFFKKYLILLRKINNKLSKLYTLVKYNKSPTKLGKYNICNYISNL